MNIISDYIDIQLSPIHKNNQDVVENVILDVFNYVERNVDEKKYIREEVCEIMSNMINHLNI